MKRPRLTSHGRKDHGYCCWCKRQLTSSQDTASTAFTYDHVVAESRGGRRFLPCCRKCNELKADLPISCWLWFIDNHPRWWRTFSSSRQVRDVIVAEQSRRVRAGTPPLSRILLGGPGAARPGL